MVTRAMLARGMLALALLASLGVAVSLWGPSPTAPPSVVVYLIDTLRADHLSGYGYERPTSPQLDLLAREGVRFERAYAPSSWTKPSVASLFTGLFPSRHGAVGKPHRIRPGVASFPELLQQHGYRTAAFISNPNVLPVFGFGRGFDDVVDIGAQAWAEGRPAARAREVNQAVFSYLEDQEERPLFLYVHVLDPHKPYGAPPGPFRKAFYPEARKQDDRERLQALYDGEIAYVDDLLADFFRRLREHGLYDDAILAVLSDHGEEFWDHGGTGHGHTLYEEQLWVPLVMRLPRAAQAGREIERPVRLLDLMPTVADLAGIDPPEGIDGLSFASLLEDAPQAMAYDPPLYAELAAYGHVVTSLVEDGYKLIRRNLPVEQRAEALYRLGEGSDEQRDLAGEEPQRLRRLRQRLDALESSLFGGFFVEVFNGLDPSAEHHIEGRLESVDGPFPAHEAMEHPEAFRLAADGRALVLDVSLRNQKLSFRQNPPLIMDHVRLRLETDKPLLLSLAVDSRPLAPEQLLLGGEHVAVDPWPMRLDPTAPLLRLQSPGLLGQPSGIDRMSPYVIAYSVPPPGSAQVPMDPVMEERLRALGYFDSP